MTTANETTCPVHWCDLQGNRCPECKAEAVEEEARDGYYLVTAGPDGAYSKIVKGMEAVYRTLLSEVIYDDIEAVPADDAMYWKGNLQDEDQWEGTFDFPFWRLEVDFEDGGFAVQRVLDVSELCK